MDQIELRTMMYADVVVVITENAEHFFFWFGSSNSGVIERAPVFAPDLECRSRVDVGGADAVQPAE